MFVRLSLIPHTPYLIPLLMLLLPACQSEATPFPVDIPSSPTTTPIIVSRVRYALAANTGGFVPDLDLLNAAGEVEQLTEDVKPADVGTRFDIVAAYGDLPGGSRSPVMPHISLVINTAAPPLNDPALASVVQRNLDTRAIVNEISIEGAQPDVRETAASDLLRQELANAGFPDGFDLTIGHTYTPGALQIAKQFDRIGLITRLLLMDESELMAAFASGQLHLALIAWTTPESRQEWAAHFGEENVIDLYALPISYLASPGLSITFTVNGWPLAAR